MFKWSYALHYLGRQPGEFFGPVLDCVKGCCPRHVVSCSELDQISQLAGKRHAIFLNSTILYDIVSVFWYTISSFRKMFPNIDGLASCCHRNFQGHVARRAMCKFYSEREREKRFTLCKSILCPLSLPGAARKACTAALVQNASSRFAAKEEEHLRYAFQSFSCDLSLAASCDRSPGAKLLLAAN